jgi:hypothetical protein
MGREWLDENAQNRDQFADINKHTSNLTVGDHHTNIDLMSENRDN